MVKSLDELTCNAYCRRLAFKKENQEMIVQKGSSPSGSNPKGYVRVWYPSKKMPSIIKAESRRVEFPWALEVEYDDSVLKHFNQPPLSSGVDGDLLNEFLGRE